MNPSPECPCGRPRAGCEYHDPALQPAAAQTERHLAGITSPQPRRPKVGDTLLIKDCGGVPGVVTDPDEAYLGLLSGELEWP